MIRRSVLPGVVTALVVALCVGTGAPVGAITFGSADDGRHPSVGSLIGEIDGVGYQWCTGTLVSPTVFVTASHCFDGFDWLTFSVTFDETIDADMDGRIDDGVTRLTGAYHMHPLYGSGGANDTYDVAVFVLDERSAEQAASITPSKLATAGLLDRRSIKKERFTTVGYGTVRDDKTGGPKSLEGATGRKYATQSVNSVVKSWITFSMNPSTGDGGTCYGDSGGPHFLGAGETETDIVVAVTVTGDRWCRSTDKTYRLDTPSARGFLGSYVTLP